MATTQARWPTPVEPPALLVAVEMLPDIVRALGNVTADAPVTTVVDRTAAASSSSNLQP